MPNTSSDGNDIKCHPDITDAQECQNKRKESSKCSYFVAKSDGCCLKTAKAAGKTEYGKGGIFGPKICKGIFSAVRVSPN